MDPFHPVANCAPNNFVCPFPPCSSCWALLLIRRGNRPPAPHPLTPIQSTGWAVRHNTKRPCCNISPFLNRGYRDSYTRIFYRSLNICWSECTLRMFTLKTLLFQYFASHSLHFFHRVEKKNKNIFNDTPTVSPWWVILRNWFTSSFPWNIVTLADKTDWSPHNKSFIQVDNFDWGD